MTFVIFLQIRQYRRLSGTDTSGDPYKLHNLLHCIIFYRQNKVILHHTMYSRYAYRSSTALPVLQHLPSLPAGSFLPPATLPLLPRSKVHHAPAKEVWMPSLLFVNGHALHHGDLDDIRRSSLDRRVHRDTFTKLALHKIAG